MQIFKLTNRVNNTIKVVADDEADAKRIALKMNFVRKEANVTCEPFSYGKNADAIILGIGVKGQIGQTFGWSVKSPKIKNGKNGWNILVV